MKKVLFVCVCLFFASFHAFFDVRGRVFFPKEQLKEQLSLIESVKEIKTPFLFRAFNPGVIGDGNGYLLVARCDRFGLRSVVSKWMGHDRRPKLFVFLLNEYFDVLEQPSCVSVIKNCQGQLLDPNDPRVIEVDGKIFIIYNDMVIENGVRVGDRFMHIAEMVRGRGGYEIISITRLMYEKANEFYAKGLNKPFCEKNWTPVVVKGEVYFIYMIDPLIVLKLDPLTGVCSEVERSDFTGFSKFGSPRGGTPLIQDENHLLGIYHIRMEVEREGLFKRGGYYFGAFQMDCEDSFQIRGVMDAVITGKGLYEGRKKIVYPTGIVDRGDAWVLFWGEEDQKICVGKIDKVKLKQHIKVI